MNKNWRDDFRKLKPEKKDNYKIPALEAMYQFKLNQIKWLMDKLDAMEKQNKQLRECLKKIKIHCHSYDNDAINTIRKKELHEILNIICVGMLVGFIIAVVLIFSDNI